MAKPDIVTVEKERLFQIDQLFFSTTDLKGIIESGNEVFARIAGYPQSELLGKPHNLIRHPDMPRAVFWLLWEYIEAGKPIVAYVKNRACDGCYYWVVALVAPLGNSYLSVRFKPCSQFFPLVEEVYKELRAIELNFENNDKGRKAGMAASVARLGEILQSKGFNNYDEFMNAFLAEEMRSRARILASSTRAYAAIEKRALSPFSMRTRGKRTLYDLSCSLQEKLDDVFGRLATFAEVESQLAKQLATILSFVTIVRRSSLNAAIQSAAHREQGAPLETVAAAMSAAADDAELSLEGIRTHIKKVTGQVQSLSFRVCAARLQIEMNTFFEAELMNHSAETDQAISNPYAPSTADVLKARRALMQAFVDSWQCAERILAELKEEMSELQWTVERLEQHLLSFRFIHLNGKIEAARVDAATSIQALFEETLNHLESVAGTLQELVNNCGRINQQEQAVRITSLSVADTLNAIQSLL